VHHQLFYPRAASVVTTYILLLLLWNENDVSLIYNKTVIVQST